ncbi:MAG: ComEC/Rec2 family competence protein [Bacteroidales bacterium]|nr:MAG: ComEC/Rec2 family competence protein [Bacteroidales bacterium]
MTGVEEYRQWPYARFLLPFLAGILFRMKIPLSGGTAWFLFILSVVSLFLVFIWQRVSPEYPRRWLFGGMLHVMLFMTGILILSQKESRENFMEHTGKSNKMLAVVTEMPVEKPGSFKTVIEIRNIETGNRWYRTRGKILVYFEKDSLSGNLVIGDRILCEGSCREVQFLNNPLEFNYRKYLHRRDIYCQLYLPSEGWKKAGMRTGNTLRFYSGRLRYKLLNVYEKNNITEDELAVASALTLGFRDYLDQDIQQLYADSGVMHVLAISGLHVGIIYFLLFYFLMFLMKFRYGRVVRAILIILFLWFFAFLTGLSPSVMRAATMFSFLTVGQSMKRPGNIYNTIAASAFFLLLLNPNLIAEVGFQLSYVAVTGIIFFQPRFYRIFRSRFWIIDKIWGLITVALAAQLVTFPISTYYFHQFPNYFLISNIISIPAVTIIIYLGILLFLFSFLPGVAGIIAWFMSRCIKLLNSGLSIITGFPYPLTEGISNTIPEIILIYAIIIFATVYLIRRKFPVLAATLVFIIALVSTGTFQDYKSRRQKLFIVYNVQGESVVSFVNGRKMWFACNNNDGSNRETVLYHIKNHLDRLDITEMEFLNMDGQNIWGLPDTGVRPGGKGPVILGNFIFFQGLRIYMSGDDRFAQDEDGLPLDLDFLVCRNDYGMDITGFMNRFRVNMVIIDSSCSPSYAGKTEHEFRSVNVPAYHVSEKGAWVSDL